MTHVQGQLYNFDERRFHKIRLKYEIDLRLCKCRIRAAKLRPSLSRYPVFLDSYIIIQHSFLGRIQTPGKTGMCLFHWPSADGAHPYIVYTSHLL